jgi:hypothetical protein
VQPPAALGRFGRYQRLEESFEKVWKTADLLLFDYPSSTTFGVALRTTKPIVLIDFGQFDWLPAAAQGLRQRCAVVDGRIDGRNRLMVSWEALQGAIARAPALVASTAFRRAFLES